MKRKQNFIIGIDEAGRGPLAGPVYAGVVALPKNHQQLFKKTNAPKKLADSKKLSPAQREEWFLWMRKNNISYAYASVSAKQIDTINISRASNLAAQKAYNKVKGERVKGKVDIIADGGLKIWVEKYPAHAPNKRTRSDLKKLSILVCGFPKADELVPAVSLASIVAKVMRDRYMVRLDKKYPRYGLAIHKGYGTKKHYAALKKHGPSPMHRLTFLTSLRTMKRNKGR